MNTKLLQDIDFLTSLSNEIKNQDSYATGSPIYLLMKTVKIEGVDPLLYPNADKKFALFDPSLNRFIDLHKSISEEKLNELNIEQYIKMDEDYCESLVEDCCVDNETNNVYKAYYTITKSGSDGKFIDAFFTEKSCMEALKREEKRGVSDLYMYVASAYKNNEIKELQAIIDRNTLSTSIEKNLILENVTNKTVNPIKI